MPERITLPATVADFVSPEGKRAIRLAEQRLNAMANTTLIIIDTAGVEHKAVIEIAGETAVARIRL